MNNFWRFPSVQGEVRAIRQLAHQLGGDGFSDMMEEEANKLLYSHDEEPSDEDLQQMIDDPHASNDDNNADVTPTPHTSLTTKLIQDILQVADDLNTIYRQ